MSDEKADEKSLVEQWIEEYNKSPHKWARSQDQRGRISSGPKFFTLVQSNGDETQKYNHFQFYGEAVAAQIETWFDEGQELDDYLFPILRQLAVLYQKNDYLTDQPDHLITIREVLLWAIAESGDPFLDSMVDDFCHDEDAEEEDEK